MRMKLAAGIALLSFCLASIDANAFKVSPVEVELTIPRGQTKDVVLTLWGSKGSNGEDLSIYPTNLAINKMGIYSFKRMDGSKFSASSWIGLSDARLALAENGKKELKVKISVPVTAQPGEYYSIIMIEPVAPTKMKAKNGTTVIDFKARIYVTFILNVPGRIYERKGQATPAEMVSVSKELVREVKSEANGGSSKDDHQLFYSLPSLDPLIGKTLVVTAFRNASNTHLLVSGKAIIRSKDERTSFGEVKLKAAGSEKEQVFTFPGDERTFFGIWDKKLPKGDYVADVAFDYGDKVRKAISHADFSISEDPGVDESKAEFLVVEKSIDLHVPVGASRTMSVKVSNSDYRPINVSFVPDPGVRVEPSEALAINPGQSKNVMFVVSNDSSASQKELKVVAKPDRGLSSEIRLHINGATNVNPKQKQKEEKSR
jgi:hypothetical protein